ncbi:DUF4118 domain-containing protein [Streptomyces sp. NPDC090131]|uniref:DUF4118 domain-containing protein n=1 Tax=Streptomyces sp. NPDC090131 TaxID=3365954 RepID=UPI00380EA7C4
MVVVVVAAAALGTRAAGALAALSATAWFDFFLTRPYGQFAIDNGEEIQTAVLLLVVGLIVSQLAVRVRRLRTVVVADTADMTSLRGSARLAEDGGSPEEVVEYVRRELVGLLGLRGCRFQYGSLIGHLPRLEHDGGLWLRRGDRITEYAEWPDVETELRVFGGGHYYGRSSSTRSPDAPCRPKRPAWWPSPWPRRQAPPWTRPACPTRAERRFTASRVRTASRVPRRPYGARQSVLTPG